MIPSDTSSAAFPTLSNCNLWLWEGRVKCVHSELPRATILQGDEKSVHFLFPLSVLGNFYVNLGYKEIRILKGHPASCFFVGPSHRVHILSFW